MIGAKHTTEATGVSPAAQAAAIYAVEEHSLWSEAEPEGSVDRKEEIMPE